MVGGWIFFSIDPGSIRPRDATAVSKTYSLNSQYPLGTHLYIGNSQKLGSLQLNYGLRYSTFGSYKKGWEYSYANGSDIPVDSAYGKSLFAFHRIDPRVSISFTNKKIKYSASYDKTTQYFHLLANSSVGLPTDVWLPSSNNIHPQRADIFSVTTEYLPAKLFSPSLSVYYKSVNRNMDFIDNADLFVNKYVESQLRQGTAKAYGMEFMLQKATGKFTGFLSYTLSKAEVTINGVNRGEPFPSRYDKRHNLSLNAKIEVSKRLQASMNFVYTTGGAITVPTGNFVFDGVVFNYYSSRNGYRLPVYHRLDLSLKYTPRKNEGRKWSSFWSFDIYNVYGRKNPFTVFSRQADYGFGQTNVSMIYLFGIVPSLTYNFKF